MGMVINHNLSALNTYNQLNANNSLMNNSLQRLSSGYRINTAADDAAGLAISEKMRGQIRGLDQANANAQDAISMTQTAEGALDETTSILQRMRELAVQASTDTLTDDDRTAVQDEMDALTSEINRIGNTTEFNTKKLLNGGQQVKTNATLSDSVLQNGSAVVTHNATAAAMANGTNATAATLTTTSNPTAADLSGIGDDVTMSIEVDGTTYTVANDTLQALGAGATVAQIQAAMATATDSNGNLITTVADFSNDGTDISIATKSTLGTGSNIEVTYQGAVAADRTAVAGVTGLAEADSAAGTNATKATQVVTFTGVPTEGASLTLSNGKKVAFYDSVAGAFDTVDQAKAGLDADYVVDVNGLTTATQVAGALVAKDTEIAGYTFSNVAGAVTITSDTNGALASTSLVTVGANVATATAATGFISFSKAPADGSSITIGGKTIGFYDSSTESYTNDVSAKAGMSTDFVVDVKGLSVSQVVDKLVSMNADINTALTDDVVLSKELVADGSVKLNVTAQATGFAGNLITLAKSADTTKGFDATFQIGANTGQTMGLNISDMRSDALNVSSTTASSTVTVQDSDGNDVTASYKAVSSVTDGTSDTNTEYSLDVSTADKATAAISVIDQATSNVSATRSKLGAVINRLEHTINNLTTTSENMTSAESRIRDVDMASEMATYTNKSVLNQAATAMLAKANQQPQQVLSLLQG